MKTNIIKFLEYDGEAQETNRITHRAITTDDLAHRVAVTKYMGLVHSLWWRQSGRLLCCMCGRNC